MYKSVPFFSKFSFFLNTAWSGEFIAELQLRRKKRDWIKKWAVNKTGSARKSWIKILLTFKECIEWIKIILKISLIYKNYPKKKNGGQVFRLKMSIIIYNGHLNARNLQIIIANSNSHKFSYPKKKRKIIEEKIKKRNPLFNTQIVYSTLQHHWIQSYSKKYYKKPIHFNTQWNFKLPVAAISCFFFFTITFFLKKFLFLVSYKSR